MNATTVDTVAVAASSVRTRRSLYRGMQAGLILVLLLSGGAIALFALDNILHLSPVFRIILGVGFILAAGAFWLRFCLSPLLHPVSREEAVIMIERAMPELDNRLINAERLGRDARTPAEILQLIHAEAAGMISVFDLRKVTPLNPLRKLAILSGCTLVALLLYAALLPDHFHNAFSRYTRPTAAIAPITRTKLTVTPGDIKVVEGETVVIKAELGGEIPNGSPRIFADKAAHEMRNVGAWFVHEFPNVESSFTYSVQAGDAESDIYNVTVQKRCKIEKITMTYTYPEYLKKDPETKDSASGIITAVEGTRVTAVVKTSKKLQSIDATISAGNTIDRKDDGWSFQVQKSGTYAFTWRDEDNLPGKSPVYEIKAQKDLPPTVRLVEPARETNVQPDGELRVLIQAKDDFGLAGIQLEAGKGTLSVIEEQPITEPQVLTRNASFVLRMKDQKAKVGDTFAIRAVAKDLKGQEARSEIIRIHVVNEATVKQEIIKEVKSISARLQDVIAEQRRVHTLTLALKPAVEPLVRDQTGIYKTLKEIHTTWDNRDLVHMRARKLLDDVITGPASSAIAQLRGDMKDIEAARKTQDTIVADLQAIVALLDGTVAKAQAEGVEKALQQAEKTPKQLAKDILNGLKDFENDQKKVIQESMDLKLKAAEDYTDEDKKKLEHIKQTEEKWGKFFQEKAQDMSRLSPQDMTNGTSSKELNEIASEIKAAAEKADKKATELAIPLEEGGLELAKSIESNIEKFLAGAPDDVKWNQEDNNKDVDVPMQDLPAELEDIIGDLIDKDDKLAEEAQDVTSNWLDSMDKGVGWGVSDGPISDMSAKGITGNVQPNSNEVNGRSGEGRNGKSSGQFAEKTADGKGGKQTPTRSTADPFEAGRVEDKSKEESGGSTGGGKISGGNKEGLRGVPPPPSKEKMDRLADSQADLRNAAEKANVAMQKRGYVSQDFVKAIDRMKTIEGQLRGMKGANYTGEMKAVGEKLKTVKKSVRDAIDVNHDTSGPLTKRHRDDTQSANDEHVPSEFKDWVKEYNNSLNQ